MGIHLSVFDCKSGKEHEEWDWLRHFGDADLVKFLFTEPVTHPACPPRGYDSDNLFRPARSGAKVRDFAKEFDANQDRWATLADLLDGNPDLYLHASY